MAKRRYLTKTQHAVLKCMAQNNGRADIFTGTRWSTYQPGHAHIFKQGLHCLLHYRWITNKGANQRTSYAWTDEGREVFERGWYTPKLMRSYWLDEQPEPASTRAA